MNEKRETPRITPIREIRKATANQLDYIESLALEAGYTDGAAAWAELKKLIDRAAINSRYENMTLRQAGVLIEILDEKAEDLTAQKREEAEAYEKAKQERQNTKDTMLGYGAVIVIIILIVWGFQIWDLITGE